MMEKSVVGRNEYISIPELEFYDIEAKIDTGADSCSIHCDEIYLNENGTVHFKLLDDSHPNYSQEDIVMPVHKIKKVKSSNGKSEERIFIKTAISIVGKTYMAEISLTNRKDMKYPMLIGRKFLEKRFLVDVSLKYKKKV
ncbi:RimK/LysX family protein [bacterium]|nr:RimK/LysX family protein [bacterium]MBU1989854.1 RimK/LysX family protein [bacterium]